MPISNIGTHTSLPTVSSSSPISPSRSKAGCLANSTRAVENTPKSITVPPAKESKASNTAKSCGRLKIALESMDAASRNASPNEWVNERGQLNFERFSLEELFGLIIKNKAENTVIEEYAAKFCDANFAIPDDFYAESDVDNTLRHLKEQGLLCDYNAEVLAINSKVECIDRRDELNENLQPEIINFLKKCIAGDHPTNEKATFGTLVEKYSDLLYKEGLIIMDEEARVCTLSEAESEPDIT